MTTEQIEQLRARLNVGPVVFCRDFLGIPYNTGRHYLSGESPVPPSVAMTARIWCALLDAGRVDEMLLALGVSGKPKPYRRKPKNVDLSFLTARKGTGYA